MGIGILCLTLPLTLPADNTRTFESFETFTRIAYTSSYPVGAQATGPYAQTGAYDSDSGGLLISPAGAYATYIYDTTPADGTTTQNTFTVSGENPFSFSMDFVMGKTGSSLGVYIVDPSDETKGYLALYNITSSSSNANDQLRFTWSCNPSTAAGANYSGLSGNQLSNVSGLAPGDPGTLVFTYGIGDDDKGYMKLDVYKTGDPSLVATCTYAQTTGTPLTTFEIALRLTNGSGAGDSLLLKNITGPFPIPEPATAAAVLAASALACLALRRCRFP